MGNCWSVFLGFRGGKGVATGSARSSASRPNPRPAVVLLTLAVVFRFVSMASIFRIGSRRDFRARLPSGFAVAGSPW
jgi:glycerol-3-phosphate acyltransferase PlsY